MRTAVLVSCFSLLAGIPAQGSAPAGDGRLLGAEGSFSVVLPSAWRQVTPDEARAIGKREARLPPDLLSPRPAAFYPYGDVDRWLHLGFDGRCMTVAKTEGEPSIDEDGLAEVGRSRTSGGWRRDVIEATKTELGPDHSPALQCIAVLDFGDGARRERSLELFVPSGGDTLLIAFRAWDEDFDAALPLFRSTAETLRFARPPRGPPKLGPRLVYPAFVGALIGIVLLLLRKRSGVEEERPPS